MEFIQNVKLFFESLGLNWNGTIYNAKTKDFIEAKEEDFNSLKKQTYMLDFRDGDSCGLVAEISHSTFIVNGEDFELSLYENSPNYIENIKKIESLDNIDLSEKFIKFSLKNMGLVYALLIKRKFEEKKEVINSDAEKRQKQLTRKIDFLNKSLKLNEQTRAEKIEQIDAYLNMTEDVIKTLK